MAEANNDVFDGLCQQLNVQDKVAGGNQMDILNLPPPLGSTLNKITRQGSMTVTEFADDLHLTPEQGEHLVKILVDKGYLHAVTAGQQTVYKIYFAAKPKKRVSTDVWDALDV